MQQLLSERAENCATTPLGEGVRLAADGEGPLEQLELAQRADQEWRAQRRAELKAQLVRLDRLDRFPMNWGAVLVVVLASNAIEWLLHRTFSGALFGLSPFLAKSAVDLVSLILAGVVGLWLYAARRKWLKRELAQLSPGEGGGHG